MSSRSPLSGRSVFGLLVAAAACGACSDAQPTAPVATPPLVKAATLTASGAAGLLGEYDFNEGSGTVAHDLSGNGADAALLGNAGWSTDVPIPWEGDYSLSLSNAPTWTVAAAGWAVIPEASLALNPTGLTLAAWVKGGPGEQAVISKQLYGSIRDSFVLFRWGGSWGFSIDGDNTGNVAMGIAWPDPTEWTHVAATYDGTTMKLYLDGALVASRPAGTVMTFSGEPVTIGADYDIFGHAVPDLGWNGQIDDVEIHDHALSDAEIAQLASTTPPPPPSSGDPATKADCMKGGWAEYGFRNQGQCVRFVETGKDSR